jgi:sugar phosphate isomerase/epimerase
MAVGVGAVALGLTSETAHASLPRTRRGPGVRLGVASYSLRNFTRAQAIAMLGELRVTQVNLKSMHLPYSASTQDFSDARAAFTAAGLDVVGGGTITFDADTDSSVNAYFEYARNAGMPLIVATCDPAVLPRVERLAIRHNIKVAIHNHGPEDKHYPSPRDVLKHVRNMDARMGLCIDIGHTVRAGTDVVEAIREAGPRLHDLHLKDLRDTKNVASQCIVGEGVIPIPDILRELAATRFAGCANLEYEIDAANPLPGMQRSLAYLRGVLAGIDAVSKRD